MQLVASIRCISHIMHSISFQKLQRVFEDMLHFLQRIKFTDFKISSLFKKSVQDEILDFSAHMLLRGSARAEALM